MKDVHKITLTDYEAKIGVQANDIIPVEDQVEGLVVSTPQRGKVKKSLPSPPEEEDDQNEEIGESY